MSMDYMGRLAAATTPRLEYLCECGHDDIQWGPSFDAPRVNKMRPMRFKPAFVHRLAEIERPFLSFDRVMRKTWKAVQRTLREGMEYQIVGFTEA